MVDAPVNSYWSENKREVIASDLFVSAARFFAMDIPDPWFLVNQLVIGAGVTILGGDPGSGKSWVAYDLIRAALTGTPWMGRSAPAADGRGVNCALINFDQPTVELKRRLGRLGIEPSEHLFLHTIGVRGRPVANDIALKLPHAMPALIELFHHRSIRLAVFDSMRQSHEADENDSNAMGEIMAVLRKISESAQCLIVLIQHLSKSAGDIRGSGEINAALDASILIKGQKQQNSLIGTMTFKKTRSWVLPGSKNAFKYRVFDDGGRTLVQFTEDVPGVDELESNLNLVLQCLASGPKEPEQIKVLLDSKINRHQIAIAVRLGKKRGKIISAREGGGNARRIGAVVVP